MGTWLKEFNSLEAIAYQYLDYHFLGMNLFRRLEMAAAVTREEVMAMAENLLIEENKSVSMVLPA